MKKQIILYLGTFLIAFFVIYTKNLTSDYYPVTSTFGIEGNKISYRLDKIHYGIEPFKVIILTDLIDLKGKLNWKQDEKNNEVNMIHEDRIITANIPGQNPVTKIYYQVILNYNNRDYAVPRDGSYISLEIFGGIPNIVKWLHYLLLFSGLFLSIRTGLEVFAENRKSKKFSVIVLAIFIVYGIMINPLKNSYKLGVINNFVPEITELFDLQAILFVLIWMLGVIFIFNKRNPVPGVIFASFLSLINFILFPIIL